MLPSAGVNWMPYGAKGAVAIRWIFVGFACTAVAVGISYMVLVHLSLGPTCELVSLESRPSPNGRFVASVFRKDCGATTDYVTGVVLQPIDEAFDDDSRDVVLVMKGIVLVTQSWTTENEIHLRLPPFDPIFRQVDRWNEIKVTIEQ